MSDSALVTLESSFQLLSIEAVLFSTLSALFGAYFVLFVIAVWSTYRHQSSVFQLRLRVITIVQFVVLCVHYIMRVICFAQDRSMKYRNEPGGGPIALLFVASLSATTAALLADSLLAWRLYVIYGRTRWALYLPASAVILTALVGYASNLQDLGEWINVTAFETHIEQVAFQINAAWGWLMFATNTMLTGSILGRIIYVARKANCENAINPGTTPYSTLMEAVIESALVTWIGLLLYGIATVAPEGHITTNMDIGFVMICVIPIFFGISQCLITVRLGIQNRLGSACTTRPDSAYSNGFMQGGSTGRGIIVEVKQAGKTDAQLANLGKRGALTADSDSEQSSVIAIERDGVGLVSIQTGRHSPPNTAWNAPAIV